MSTETDIPIPPEAVEAARKAFADAGTADDDLDPIEAAITAALRAWPGMFGTELEDYTGVYRKIILPLPREKRDG